MPMTIPHILLHSGRINSLEKESKMLLHWLESNYLKANPDRFRLLLNNKDTVYMP